MTLNLCGFDAAIVDLDGTLVDTLGDFVAALDRMLDDLALPRVAPAVVEQRVGKGSEHLVLAVLEHVLAQAQLPAGAGEAMAAQPQGEAQVRARALFDHALACYQRHYGAVNGRHSRVYPGVVPGLEALRARGLRLACLTNKPAGFARALLGAKGLDGFFEQVFGGDDFERKKPDPLPLLKTCEALGTSPARTLMVGDSGNDAHAARAAGCPVVLVTYGYNHGEPVRAVDADGFVDSLARLAASSLPCARRDVAPAPAL